MRPPPPFRDPQLEGGYKCPNPNCGYGHHDPIPTCYLRDGFCFYCWHPPEDAMETARAYFVAHEMWSCENMVLDLARELDSFANRRMTASTAEVAKLRTDLHNEIDLHGASVANGMRLRRAAEWFANNEPGTPVPNWVDLVMNTPDKWKR